MLARLRHRYILNFIGASLRPPNLAIITEFIDTGSLYDTLFSKTKRINFQLYQKTDLMYQVAQAMLYLHQCKIIHRDLKSKNVLVEALGNIYVPKVCDFGLAKSKDSIHGSQNSNTLSVGTPLYMAPEVVISSSYDNKCDVFSFGIMLWEYADRLAAVFFFFFFLFFFAKSI